jgi:penicillin-binding protein 2
MHETFRKSFALQSIFKGTRIFFVAMRTSFLDSRVCLFIAGITAFFSLLMVRTIELQVFKGEKYLAQAEENRFYTQPLPARRGVILDRYGEPLVWNVQRYFFVANPRALYESRTPISREDALQLYTSTQSAQVATDTERLYRYPFALAHTLGYVGEVTAEDLQRDESLEVGQHIGKAGLEYTYENQLRGVDGKQVFEIDALAQKQRQVRKTDPQPGHDLQTTLDPYLSEVAAKELTGKKGTLIMTDVETGKVIALVSQPAFDPNILSQTFLDKDKELQRKAQVQTFFQDENKLFFNRAVSGAYPPGSIFKVITSLAGLENQKLTASTQVVDEGKIQVGEFEYGNWYYRQYGRVEGPLTIVRALARSNDIFFYKVAEWTGPDKLAEMARAFGLGDKTGIDLPAEAKGLVPDTAWKEKVRGEKWFLGNTYHYGIGQGDLLTSPIQMAQVTQAIGNGGRLCTVSLSKEKSPDCRDENLKDENLELVLEGMLQACSTGGTAFPFFPYNTDKVSPGQSAREAFEKGAVACKTGTAEFGAADEQGHRRTHAWFTMITQLPELGSTAAASEETKTASESADIELTASSSAQVSMLSNETLFQKWHQEVEKHGFPHKVSITVMLESDEQKQFKEGSSDAAPIAKKLIDWMVQAKK